MSANGRLEKGTLHLPPRTAVAQVFAVGCEAAGILENGQCELATQQTLWLETAHDSFNRLRVRQARHRGKRRGLSPELAQSLEDITEAETGVSPLLDAVRTSVTITATVLRYWSGILCAACCKPEDASALVEVLGDQGLHHAHSAAKKALLGIDFAQFGPRVG